MTYETQESKAPPSDHFKDEEDSKIRVMAT